MVSQHLCEGQRLSFPSFPNRHHGDRAPRQGRFGYQHRQSLDTSRPADPGQRRPAHHFDQPIISTAAHHSAWRAEIGRHKLECGMGIIIEPTHQPWVQPVDYAEPIEPGADPIEEVARLSIQVIGKNWSILSDAPVGFLFRIKNAQRVALEPPLAVLRKFGGARRKVGDERLAVSAATLAVAERIEFEYNPVTYAERVKDAAA